ncbi:MAG: ribonuclease HI [Hyphomicrobiales bacterium]|nr:MAG: ribonuclease HI [Hyphomicrobiales bacterium]
MELSEKHANKVVIYTDGACSGNPGPGGWGVWMSYNGKDREMSGFDADTTNNRMELRATIEALNVLKRSCDIVLYTDSVYVKDGINKWMIGWKARNWRTAAKKPVKNVELWKALDEATQRHNIDWRWVKGHAGNVGNEKADLLATGAIEQARAAGRV